MLTDILVPVVSRQRDDDELFAEHYCTLCDVRVSYDYSYQPELHTLDICLAHAMNIAQILKGDVKR